MEGELDILSVSITTVCEVSGYAKMNEATAEQSAAPLTSYNTIKASCLEPVHMLCMLLCCVCKSQCSCAGYRQSSKR